MSEFYRAQSNGTYVSVVDVALLPIGEREVCTNRVSIITDHVPTAVEVEEEALNIMCEQIVDEGNWARVLGASIAPFEVTR